MSNQSRDPVDRYAAALGPRPDAVLDEMRAYGEETGFPIIGPEVGGWLQLLARLVDANRVLELGSGFGYSAYWFARALSPDDEIVLTDADADNLDAAREYLDRGGFADRAVFEVGDAIETANDLDGPFDVVLLDLHKHQYEAAFEAVCEKVSPGGVVVADNMLTLGETDIEGFLDAVTRDDAAALDGEGIAAGIAAYAVRVRNDPAFETSLIPLGNGLAVSYRVE